MEKLTSINKKVSSETINTIKQLKDPSQIADNIEEVIVDAGAAKGQSQPILVHSKADSKSKSNKPSAA